MTMIERREAEAEETRMRALAQFAGRFTEPFSADRYGEIPDVSVCEMMADVRKCPLPGYDGPAKP